MDLLIATSQASTVFVELGVLLLGLGVLARFAHHWGVSAVPFYLLGGLAFGEGGILSLPASDEFVGIAAELGAILLLLLLGLEFSGPQFAKGVRKTALAGAVDLVANALPGVVAALVLGWGPVAAVALGGVSYCRPPAWRPK